MDVLSVRGLLAAVFSAALAGCTAIIGGPPDPGQLLPCVIEDGFDPCPEGSSCNTELGHCVIDACSGNPEVCNGIDDDCDGTEDEPDAPLCPADAACVDGVCIPACRVDADGDGFSRCGDPADCDDERDAIRPGAQEVCNGVDDDCNPATVDGNACAADEVCAVLPMATQPSCLRPDCTNILGCPDGQRCNIELRECEPVVSDCRRGGAESCAAAQRCDPGSGACVELRELGTSCNSDVQCTSERCVSYAALRLPPDPGGALGICTSACCSDAQCAAGSRCWSSASGARACLPTAMVPLEAAATVCSGASCTAPDVCDVRSVSLTSGSAVGMFVCTSPLGGTGNTRDACVTSDDCASGLCRRPSTGFGVYGEGWCALPCGRAADCNYPIDPVVDFFAGDRGCGVSTLTSGDRIQLCQDFGSGAPAGTSCADDGECLERFCRPDCVAGACTGSDPRICSATCCSDADCSGAEVCAPVNRPSGWEMRCVSRFPTRPD